MIRVSLVLACFALLLTPLSAAPLVGRASVIDGDTIDIRGARIRLHLDAPSTQLCQDMSGTTYRCGQKSALALSDKIGTANVSCEEKDTDRYQRTVAVCSMKGEDLNAWLVREGYAMAYRQYGTDYISEEERARAAKRGLWAGTFTPPWDWRKGNGTATHLRCLRRTVHRVRLPIGQTARSKGTSIEMVTGSITFPEAAITSAQH